MNNKRAIRRKQDYKKKLKVRKILKDSWGYSEDMLDGKTVGKNTSTHARPCSCYMCGNPRKLRGEKTRQEDIEKIRELDEE